MSCWVLLSSPGIPVLAPVCLEFNHYNNLDECNSIPHFLTQNMYHYCWQTPLSQDIGLQRPQQPPIFVFLPSDLKLYVSCDFLTPRPQTNTPEWALRSSQLDFVFHVDDQYIYDP